MRLVLTDFITQGIDQIDEGKAQRADFILTATSNAISLRQDQKCELRRNAF